MRASKSLSSYQFSKVMAWGIVSLCYHQDKDELKMHNWSDTRIRGTKQDNTLSVSPMSRASQLCRGFWWFHSAEVVSLDETVSGNNTDDCNFLFLFLFLAQTMQLAHHFRANKCTFYDYQQLLCWDPQLGTISWTMGCIWESSNYKRPNYYCLKIETFAWYLIPHWVSFTCKVITSCSKTQFCGERERERQRDRERDRETERQRDRDRDRDRQTDSQSDRQRQRERHRDRDRRETETEKERNRERERQTDRQRETAAAVWRELSSVKNICFCVRTGRGDDRATVRHQSLTHPGFVKKKKKKKSLAPWSRTTIPMLLRPCLITSPISPSLCRSLTVTASRCCSLVYYHHSFLIIVIVITW